MGAIPEEVDVAIIGGGANGTGLARDLAKRGASVALFEKGDFGRGATGASSAMIHGGPRYLLNDTSTAEHACRDSGHIQRIAPHLLFRVPFLIPVERHGEFGRFGLWLADGFCDLYDRYAKLKNGLPHARMTRDQLLEAEPGLVRDYLGAVTLDEWGTDPVRLCLLNAEDAAMHGAHVQNYVEVREVLVEEGRARGVRVRDEDGHTKVVRAKIVCNCTGAWAQRLAQGFGGELYIRAGKGVHLIFERRLSNFALIVQAVDGREMFSMPYLNETWIGTTDDDYYGDPDNLDVTEDEVAYLMEAVARHMPEIANQRLIGTRVGLRNTIGSWGKYESALSRRFSIIDHAVDGLEGVFSLVGGKLASFRVQAEGMADLVAERLGLDTPCTTHIDPLPGGEANASPSELADAYGIDPMAADRLVFRHGAKAEEILAEGKAVAGGLDLLDPAESVLECEVRHALRHEWVRRGSDLMTRCRVGMGPDMGMVAGARLLQLIGDERGGTAESARTMVLDLLRERWRSARPVMRGMQLVQAESMMSWASDLFVMPQLEDA